LAETSEGRSEWTIYPNEDSSGFGEHYTTLLCSDHNHCGGGGTPQDPTIAGVAAFCQVAGRGWPQACNSCFFCKDDTLAFDGKCPSKCEEDGQPECGAGWPIDVQDSTDTCGYCEACTSNRTDCGTYSRPEYDDPQTVPEVIKRDPNSVLVGWCLESAGIDDVYSSSTAANVTTTYNVAVVRGGATIRTMSIAPEDKDFTSSTNCPTRLLQVNLTDLDAASPPHSTRSDVPRLASDQPKRGSSGLITDRPEATHQKRMPG